MKPKMILVYSLFVSFCSCGGGGSGNGMLLEGTLVEARGATHHSMARHGAGQPIENVSVCALGDCSITDLDGRWGIIAPEEFVGGDVLVSVNGHSIDSSIAIDVPQGARHVEAALLRVEEGLALGSLKVDGSSAGEPHDHGTEEEHAH